MENFSKNLVFLRKKSNRTQSDQAEFLKIKRSTYAGYEAGTSHPDLKTLKELADSLGFPVGILIDDKISDSNATPVKKEPANAFQQELTDLQRKYIKALEEIMELKSEIERLKHKRHYQEAKN